MGIEYIDPDFTREHSRVSKLPIPLPPARSQEYYPPEYIGSGRSASVLLTINLAAAGVVEHVEAILPPPLPANLKIEAIVLGARSGERKVFEAPRTLDPLFAQAAEACVRQMRFSPAERDGEPVPFRGMRMTFVFSDPQSLQA